MRSSNNEWHTMCHPCLGKLITLPHAKYQCNNKWHPRQPDKWFKSLVTPKTHCWYIPYFLVIIPWILKICLNHHGGQYLSKDRHSKCKIPTYDNCNVHLIRVQVHLIHVQWYMCFICIYEWRHNKILVHVLKIITYCYLTCMYFRLLRSFIYRWQILSIAKSTQDPIKNI